MLLEMAPRSPEPSIVRDTPESVKKNSSGEEEPWEDRLTKSQSRGRNTVFVPLGCMAEACAKGFVVHRHRYVSTCLSYPGYVHVPIQDR